MLRLLRPTNWAMVAAAAVCAIALIASAPARAAHPVEYVKVCSFYGAGFWYLPGTDTCLKLLGRRYDNVFPNVMTFATAVRRVPMGVKLPPVPAEELACESIGPGIHWEPGASYCLDLSMTGQAQVLPLAQSGWLFSPYTYIKAYIDYYVASALGKRPVPPDSYYGRARFDWTGAYFGGSIGSQSASNTVTNQLQLTFCPPFCTPDLTPNPSASLGSSGTTAGLLIAYNRTMFNIMNDTKVVAGGEAFVRFGSSSVSRDGFPGTGGIAPWSVAANDRVTANFGSSGGVIGKIGPVFDVAGTSVYLAFDVGIGWQRVDLQFNCTMPGVCGFNGIPPQTLDWKKNMTGSLIGGEVNVPMSGLPLISQVPVLRGGTVGFQYLHGDYGNFIAPSGTPPEIQIFAKQSLTTDSYMARLAYSFAPSDIRLKRDIAPLRRLDNGLGLYRFRYLWSDVAYVGVMAQEVEQIRPDAVMRGADGYLRVNYDALGLKFQTYAEWAAAGG
jgi:hypothetical protein